MNTEAFWPGCGQVYLAELGWINNLCAAVWPRSAEVGEFTRRAGKTRREIERLQRELELMRRRDTELSTLFKRLYEDNVLGKVTNDQFRMLSGDYKAEQKSLKERIPQTAERIEVRQVSISNVTQFIDKAKRYTEINELNAEILNLFIEKIERTGREVLQNGGAGNHYSLP